MCYVMMEVYGATSRAMTEWEEKPFIPKYGEILKVL